MPGLWLMFMVEVVIMFVIVVFNLVIEGRVGALSNMKTVYGRIASRIKPISDGSTGPIETTEPMYDQKDGNGEVPRLATGRKDLRIQEGSNTHEVLDRTDISDVPITNQ